jgi:hypothetical protein
MAILSVQDQFQSGDNVTATNLNNLVNQANFVDGAGETTDGSTLEVHTQGYLKVKNNGIGDEHLQQMTDTEATAAGNENGRAVTTSHIRNDAVTNAKIAADAVDTDQIAADAVTYAKIQNVSATNRVLGRDSAGAGNVEEISPSDLRTMINVEDGATADQTGAEMKTAIGNATAHTSDTDSDGINDTGGTHGLLSAYDKTKLNSIAVNANNYSHPTGDGNLHVPATSNTNHRKLLTAGPTAGSLSWSHNNEALVGSTYTNEIAKAPGGSSGVTIGAFWPTFQSSSITATRSGRNAWIVGTYVLNTTYPSITNDEAYFTIEMPNDWKAYDTNTNVYYSHGWHRSQTSSSNSSFSSGRQRPGQAEIRGIPGTSDDGIVLYIERESGRYLYGGTFYVSFLLNDASMNS